MTKLIKLYKSDITYDGIAYKHLKYATLKQFFKMWQLLKLLAD